MQVQPIRDSRQSNSGSPTSFLTSSGQLIRTSTVAEKTLESPPKGKIKGILGRIKRTRTDPKMEFKLKLSEHDHPIAHLLLEINVESLNPQSASENLTNIKHLQLLAFIREDEIALELINHFTDLNRDKFKKIFSDSPFHPAYILFYPAEAAESLSCFVEKKLVGITYKETLAWQNFANGLTLPFGQILTTRLDDIFNLKIDDKPTSTKTKPKTFAQLAAELKDLKNPFAQQLADYLNQLALICHRLCCEVLYSRNFEIDLLALPEKITESGFQQEIFPEAVVKATSSWSEVLAQKSIVNLVSNYPDSVEYYIQHYDTIDRAAVYLLSVAKGLDGSRDTHSGDAGRSFQLKNGVTAHIVVDAPGSRYPAFESSSRLIQITTEFLIQHEVPLSNSPELPAFFSDLIHELMTHEDECTVTFNLVYPGANKKKLLVGFSAGDTWVFKRRFNSEGKWEVEEITKSVVKEMSENQGALGNLVLSTEGLSDVYVRVVEDGEQLCFTTDGVRDEWEQIKKNLLTDPDPFHAILIPFIDAQIFVNKLINIITKLNAVGNEFNAVSKEYAAMREKVMQSRNCSIDQAEKGIDELYRYRLKREFDLDEDFRLYKQLGSNFKQKDIDLLMKLHDKKVKFGRAEKLRQRIEKLLTARGGMITRDDKELLRYLQIKSEDADLDTLNQWVKTKRDDITALLIS